MFKKYIHLERLTSEEVQGLQDEACFIVPKLDGANASIWWEGARVCCGSRNNQLGEHNTLQGFYGWVQENNLNLTEFFARYPYCTIYGEWLVPHTVQGYIPEAWRNFYAFDILLEDGVFWEHHLIDAVLGRFGISTVPILDTTMQTTPHQAWESCTWLLKEGHRHEGVVIKRANFVNPYGRTTYAKYVPQSLKQVAKERKARKLQAYTDGIENAVVHEFLTEHLLDKEIAKVKLERGFTTLDPKLIGETLGRVWHALITEEIWDILKKFKNPMLDFRVLRSLVNQKVKDKFERGN